MAGFDGLNSFQWVVDWNEVKSLDELKEVLKACKIEKIRLDVDDKQFQSIRHLCKLKRFDGTTCDPDTLQPI